MASDFPMNWRMQRAVFVITTVCCLSSPVTGSPCTEGTHTCDNSTQVCVEKNNTAGFGCECLQFDHQLNENNTCVVIPESQRLFLTTPVNTSTASIFAIHGLLNDPELARKSIEKLFDSVTLPTFQTATLEAFITPPQIDIRIIMYSALFTEKITDEMREAVGKAVLALEKNGTLSTIDGSVVVPIVGYTGIFDTKDDANENVDSMDWCKFPTLYSCRNHSTCRDIGLRYDCPCDTGYLDDGSVCFECSTDFHFGPGCEQQCDCHLNNTQSCDHVNGTCYCKVGWEGTRCENDVDECKDSENPVCSVHEHCVNTFGGFQCLCKESAARDVNGTCTGPVISAPSKFETDGSRDLHLVCDPGDVLELASLSWNTPCLQGGDSSCVIRPQPPWDDGKAVTCTAKYTDDQSASMTYVVDLNYPPADAPVIGGYQGQKLTVGENLNMVCTVSGGKPLVTSVIFSCPRHPDNDLDQVSETTVRSILNIDSVVASDNGVVCECRATWKSPQLYTKTVSTILSVSEASTNGGVDILIIIVAAVGGGVIIVFIVVVIIIWKLRGSPKEKTTSSPSDGTLSTDTNSRGTREHGFSQELIIPPERHRVRNPAYISDGGDRNSTYDFVTDQDDRDLYIHATPSGDSRITRGYTPYGSDPRFIGRIPAMSSSDLSRNPIPHTSAAARNLISPSGDNSGNPVSPFDAFARNPVPHTSPATRNPVSPSDAPTRNPASPSRAATRNPVSPYERLQRNELPAEDDRHGMPTSDQASPQVDNFGVNWQAGWNQSRILGRSLPTVNAEADHFERM